MPEALLRYDGSLLSLVTFLPLATGLLLLATSALARLFGRDGLPEALWRLVALAGSLATFALSTQLFVDFDVADAGMQFVEYRPWLPAFGIHYFVGIDGISLFLVLLTTFLMPVVLVASWKDIAQRVRSYLFFMLALETGMLGAFVALNLFQFYVFWEVMLIPMYFIIGIWGGPRRIYAALKFFLFTMFGSLLMLLAILVLYGLGHEQLGRACFDLLAAPGGAGAGLLDVQVPVDDPAWWKTQYWLFAAFALAFAIKVPMFPLHTWLPDAHVEAPTAGSVVLAGVLLKMGTYGFVRFALPLFPAAIPDFSPLMLALSVIGIVYGSLVAMVQPDIKKLVAYSSVAHLGFVMLGLFSLDVSGVNGAVLQMVNHGLSTGALFLLVGMLYERRHTRLIADFGGIARPMPVFAACLGLVTMSSIGLPGLNGFVGEFLILVGTYLDHPAHALVATSGVVLAAAYMLWMVRRVMFGPLEIAENRGLIDLGRREKLVMLSMIVPIVWIGVQPSPLLSRIEPSVTALLARIEARGAAAAAPAVGVEPEAPASPAAPTAAAPEAPTTDEPSNSSPTPAIEGEPTAPSSEPAPEVAGALPAAEATGVGAEVGAAAAVADEAAASAPAAAEAAALPELGAAAAAVGAAPVELPAAEAPSVTEPAVEAPVPVAAPTGITAPTAPASDADAATGEAAAEAAPATSAGPEEVQP